MRFQGKLTNWIDEKGYGFITPNNGGKQIFVHIKVFIHPERRPIGNELVTFEVKTDQNGRIHADNVEFVGGAKKLLLSPKQGGVSSILAGLFLVFVAGATFYCKLPIVIILFYLVTSFVTFFAYAWDKSAARHDQWRTSESTLHFFALAGGWPGALIAQNLFRHKTKKESFRSIFWITVVLNCCFLGWLFTTPGIMALHAFLPNG